MSQGCKYLYLQIGCTTVLSSLRTRRLNILIWACRYNCLISCYILWTYPSFCQKKTKWKRQQLTDLNRPIQQKSIVFVLLKTTASDFYRHNKFWDLIWIIGNVGEIWNRTARRRNVYVASRQCAYNAIITPVNKVIGWRSQAIFFMSALY